MKSASNTLNNLLDQLDALKIRFVAHEHRSVERIVSRISRLRFSDADALLRYHELLLFLRAYPQNQQILRIVDQELAAFAKRVNQLEATGADLSTSEHPDASGIGGISMTDTFSYYIVRWLVSRPSGRVTLNWDWFEDENRLAGNLATLYATYSTRTRLWKPMSLTANGFAQPAELSGVNSVVDSAV